ncbi:MAG: acyltransferase [Candidatus Shapirobacteria bacterium]|nr:acyltransferase [Candidatus Shapirobacteria bacterium]
MQAIKKYIYHPELDFIRTLCIFSVIMIHTTTKTLSISGNDLVNYPFTLFLNQLSRFAVPLFFIISAFGLKLNYFDNFKYLPYLKQRLSKLLLPYLFWTSIYYYLVYPHSSKSIFYALIHGSASYQLYFIPTLFLYYLLFPLISRYSKFINRQTPLIVLLILQFIILFLDYYFRPLSFSQSVNVFLLNFFYFIFGVLAFLNQEKILNFVKKYIKIIVPLSLIMAIYITFEGALRYFKTQNYLSFYSQWRPSVLLYSITVFSLLFYLGKKVKIEEKYLKKISSYSFFVYFIHIIFIEIIQRFLPAACLYNSLLLYILVLIPSYLCAFLSSKIPSLSRLTG